MIELILSTACNTPRPIYIDFSLSRSSSASCTPVDAPDGTEAVPFTPFDSIMSASTVGFPLESMIWRAFTSSI